MCLSAYIQVSPWTSLHRTDHKISGKRFREVGLVEENDPEKKVKLLTEIVVYKH